MGKVSSPNSSPRSSKEPSAEKTPSTGTSTMTSVKRLHDGSIKNNSNFKTTLSQTFLESSTELTQSVKSSQLWSTNQLVSNKQKSLPNSPLDSIKTKTHKSSSIQTFRDHKLLQFTSTNSTTEKFLLKHAPKKIKTTKSLDFLSPDKLKDDILSQSMSSNSSIEMLSNQNSLDNTNKKSPGLLTSSTTKDCNVKNSSTHQSQSLISTQISTVGSSSKKSLEKLSWQSCAINRNYLEVFSHKAVVVLENLIYTNLLTTKQREKIRLLAEKKQNQQKKTNSRLDDFCDCSSSFCINDKTLRSLPARDERLKLERDYRLLSCDKSSSLSENDCSQQLKNFLSIDKSEKKLEKINKSSNQSFNDNRIVPSLYLEKDEERKWRTWNLESSSSSSSDDDDDDKCKSFQIIEDMSSVDLISSDELVIDEKPIKKNSSKIKSQSVKKRSKKKSSLERKIVKPIEESSSDEEVVVSNEKLSQLPIHPVIENPELPTWKVLNITRILETYCGNIRISLKINIRTESEAKRSGLFDKIVKLRKERNPLNNLRKSTNRKSYSKKTPGIKKNASSSVKKRKYMRKNSTVKKIVVKIDPDNDKTELDNFAPDADLVIKKMPSMPAIENNVVSEQNKKEKVEVKIETESDHQINTDSSFNVEQIITKQEIVSVCGSSNFVDKTVLSAEIRKLTGRKYPEIIHDTILPAGSVSLISSACNERWLPKIDRKIPENKQPQKIIINNKTNTKDLSAKMRDDRLKHAFDNWAKIPELTNLISPSSSVVNECIQETEKKPIEKINNNKFQVPEEPSQTSQKVRKKIVYNVTDGVKKESVAPLTLKNLETFTTITTRTQSHLPAVVRPTTKIRTRISPPVTQINQQDLKKELSSSISRGKKSRRDWKKASLDDESNSSSESSPNNSDNSLPKFGKSVAIEKNSTSDEPLVRRVLEWVYKGIQANDKNVEERNLSDNSSCCSNKKLKSLETKNNLPTVGNNRISNLPTNVKEPSDVIDKDKNIVVQTNKLINLSDTVDQYECEDDGFYQALNDSFTEEDELLYGKSQYFVDNEGKSVDKIEKNTDKTDHNINKVDNDVGKILNVGNEEKLAEKEAFVDKETPISIKNHLDNDDSLSISSSSSDDSSSSSSVSSSSSSTQTLNSIDDKSSGFIEATQISTKSNLLNNNEIENNFNDNLKTPGIDNNNTNSYQNVIANNNNNNNDKSIIIHKDLEYDFFNNDDIEDTDGDLIIDDDTEFKSDSDRNFNNQKKIELVSAQADNDLNEKDANNDCISIYAESAMLSDYDFTNDRPPSNASKLSGFGDKLELIGPKNVFHRLQLKPPSPQSFYNRMDSNTFNNYQELTTQDFNNAYSNLSIQNGGITTQKFRNRQMQYNDKKSNPTFNNGPVVPSYARSPNYNNNNNNNNNDGNFNNFNTFNNTLNNNNSFIKNHKLQQDLNLNIQKPKFVIDPLVDINNSTKDYVKSFFNGNCFNFLKGGICERNHCRHAHEMKSKILHMHMEPPQIINKLLIYAFEHKFHHYLRFVYLKAIQKLDASDIINFFSIIFYVPNQQLVIEYLGWTVDTLIIKNRPLKTIVNLFRDKIIEMGNMIKPPMTPGEMFYLIIHQLSYRIDPGTYWETFKPLILSQLTLTSDIVEYVLQECIDFKKPFCHVKDVHSTLILGLSDIISGPINPILFNNFITLLEDYEKMELDSDNENIIDQQFAIEIRHKPQETISLASPDCLSSNIITDNIIEPNSSIILNKYIPEKDSIQSKIFNSKDENLNNNVNILPKIQEKLPIALQSNYLNDKKSSNEGILFDNKHKLIKIDVENPKSVHEHHIWLFRADLENIQAAMKKNDYDQIIKILNINKRSQLQPFIRGFYRILCSAVMENSRHLSEIIQRTGNDYFNKSQTGEIEINFELS